jgi:hypothetical protein
MKTLLLVFALANTFAISSAQTETKNEALDLNREATRIENDMHLQFSALEARDPELKTLTEKAAQAASTAQQAVDAHPELADLRLRRDAAYAKLEVIIGKGSKGEDAEKQSAQEVYATAERSLSLKARELPELQTLTDATSTAKAEHLKRREAFYAAQPETAAMAKKVAELRDRANSLNKTQE